MRDYMIIDGHCDSLGDLVNGKRSLKDKSGAGHWDLERAIQAKVRIQFFAAYIESEYKPFTAVKRGLELIQGALQFVEENKEKVFLIKHSGDIEKLGFNRPVGLLLSVEGGEILGSDLFMLDIIYNLGVRSLCLTWNERNAIGDGVGERTDSRLTDFGINVIQRMNRLGMVIDISHLNERGFWHVREVSLQPFIASHSGAYKVCAHPRNLKDEQIKALAEAKGVIGVNFCPDFLRDNGQAGIDDVVRHICYIAEIGGIDCIGLGSDFDGIPAVPEGLEGIEKVPALSSKLRQAGFKEEEIEKIFYKNFERLLLSVLK